MAIFLCSNAHISTLAAYAVQHQICLPHLKLDYRGAAAGTWIEGEPVSYTHLTLPTM